MFRFRRYHPRRAFKGRPKPPEVRDVDTGIPRTPAPLDYFSAGDERTPDETSGETRATDEDYEAEGIPSQVPLENRPIVPERTRLSHYDIEQLREMPDEELINGGYVNATQIAGERHTGAMVSILNSHSNPQKI